MEALNTAHVSALAQRPWETPPAGANLPTQLQEHGAGDERVREAFDDFVGQTLFSQMLSSMRKTVGKSAYFHGGRAEEMFRGQLDQLLAEKMSEASAASFSDSMYELFTLKRM